MVACLLFNFSVRTLNLFCSQTFIELLRPTRPSHSTIKMHVSARQRCTRGALPCFIRLTTSRLASPRLTLAPGCCWVIKGEAASVPRSPPRQRLIKSHFKAQEYSPHLSLAHTGLTTNLPLKAYFLVLYVCGIG